MRPKRHKHLLCANKVLTKLQEHKTAGLFPWGKTTPCFMFLK